jgi:hypothetical protein
LTKDAIEAVTVLNRESYFWENQTLFFLMVHEKFSAFSVSLLLCFQGDKTLRTHTNAEIPVNPDTGVFLHSFRDLCLGQIPGSKGIETGKLKHWRC